MNRKKGQIIVVAVCLFGLADGFAEPLQDSPRSAKADQWEAWRPLVGEWEGKSQGQPGKGTVKLEIGFVLKEKFLRLATTADYKSDKGVPLHHEDFGFVSFDRIHSRLVFRQFHIEGFVNEYVLTSDPKDGKKIELTSETSENSPAGWKARETYKLSGDTLEHVFELAAPGKPFEPHTTATLKQKRK